MKRFCLWLTFLNHTNKSSKSAKSFDNVLGEYCKIVDNCWYLIDIHLTCPRMSKAVSYISYFIFDVVWMSFYVTKLTRKGWLRINIQYAWNSYTQLNGITIESKYLGVFFRGWGWLGHMIYQISLRLNCIIHCIMHCTFCI